MQVCNGIFCPKCGGKMKVVLTRQKSGFISRIRKCLKCGKRKPTIEK